jgi:hypothetical protein
MISDAASSSKTLPSITFLYSPFEVIQKVALHTIKELALSLSLAIVVLYFVPTTLGVGAVITAFCIQTIVNLFFNTVGAILAYKASGKDAQQDLYEKVISFCEWVTGFSFGYFTGRNTQNLIHETGHALAAFVGYRNPRPQIEINPFIGGSTQFYKTSLTPFGKKIGPVATTCLMIASGPALALFVSTALLIIGLSLREKYPHLAKYLIGWSLLDFFNNACYAYSALHTVSSDLGHDFVHLKILGLHPLIATIGIVALPTLILLGAYCFSSDPKPKAIPSNF